jgi:hypothetical protein
VSLTPAKKEKREAFWLFPRDKDKLFSSVNDTGEKFIAGVNDIGD